MQNFGAKILCPLVLWPEYDCLPVSRARSRVKNRTALRTLGQGVEC